MSKLQFLSLLSLFRVSFETCFTTDRSQGVPCVFPFTYQGNTYKGCTNVTDADGRFWCATNVDGQGLYVRYSKDYGYCAPGCPIHREENVLDTRSAEFSIDPIDKQCLDSETCKQQDECPEFLEQKDYLKTLTKKGSKFKDTLDKIRKRVCNRKKKGVCCHTKIYEETCEDGYTCVKEDQCEYTKDLRKQVEIGNNDAKGEVISLICDREQRKFCCPKIGDRNISKDVNKSPSWLPRKGECGLNPEGSAARVLGGTRTTPGQFPFTALLGYQSLVRINGRQVKTTRFKCGGTLINHLYVVTAAHCQGKSKRSKISSVRLGDWEVGRDPDCIFGTDQCLNKAQDFRITADQVTVHKDYGRSSSGNIVNDIALVRLDRPAVLNQGVRIVCLPINQGEAAEQLNLPNLSEGLIGTYPLVVGWGYTEYDPLVAGDQQGDFAEANVASTVQQMLGVPVLSSEQCTEKWGGKFKAEETQICAGGEKSKDSCKGDSGGPLYLSRVATSGQPSLDGTEPFYLVGLVSFGSKVCGAGRPGVYTRLESFVPWIEEQIGARND